MSKPLRVLFVCTGNAGRSQIAEALCRSRYGHIFDPSSAGVDPWPDLHPMAKKLMAERGESLSGHYTKHVAGMRGKDFDLVVTIGDRALRECPAFTCSPERIHWPVPDPADADGTPDSEAVFRAALMDIENRVRELARHYRGPR